MIARVEQDELFAFSGTEPPKSAWMRHNCIRTYKSAYLVRPWMAIREWIDDGTGKSVSVYERGETEDDALKALAETLKLELWNP